MILFTDAGWSSQVARKAHNLEVAGSNPAPATNDNEPTRLLAGRPSPVRLSLISPST